MRLSDFSLNSEYTQNKTHVPWYFMGEKEKSRGLSPPAFFMKLVQNRPCSIALPTELPRQVSPWPRKRTSHSSQTKGSAFDERNDNQNAPPLGRRMARDVHELMCAYRAIITHPCSYPRTFGALYLTPTHTFQLSRIPLEPMAGLEPATYGTCSVVLLCVSTVVIILK